MLNNPRRTTTELLGPRADILFDVMRSKSVGIRLNNTGVTADADGRFIIPAGTPIKATTATGVAGECRTTLVDRTNTVYTMADITTAADALSCVGVTRTAIEFTSAAAEVLNVQVLLWGWLQLVNFDPVPKAMLLGADPTFWTEGAGQNLWILEEDQNS